MNIGYLELKSDEISLFNIGFAPRSVHVSLPRFLERTLNPPLEARFCAAKIETTIIYTRHASVLS